MKNLYRILSLTAILTALICFTGSAQNAWINEIHYDNSGTDADELIEVVIQNSGSYNLADFEVILYNGNDGAGYDNKTLDLFTAGITSNGYTFFWYNYTANGLSIQNGAPDGMALSYQGTLIGGQWLSYEGAFLASDGPASGQTSVDIGVSETNTTLAGESLQLSGSGTGYGDFFWLPPAAATPGQLNNNQDLGGGPLPEPSNYPTAFTGSVHKISVTLTWTDASGDQPPSGYVVFLSDQDNIASPVDGIPVENDDDYSDGNGAMNVTSGTQTSFFYPLNGDTEYFFKIFPYTNGGANINYKTDGTPPSASKTTSPMVHYEGFESNSFGAWTMLSVASDKDWEVVNFGGAYATTFFTQMNGYNEDAPSNDWLISPALNLDAYENEALEFFTIWKYGSADEELKLKYSTDYTGGDPTQATWTELSFTKPPAQDIWTSSGDVPLAAINGSSVYLAFQYLSSGDPRRWGVDEILISGNESVGLDEMKANANRIFPNPNNGSFQVMNPGKEQMVVAAYTVTGQLITELTVDPGENTISLKNISAGTYLLRYSSKDGKHMGSDILVIN